MNSRFEKLYDLSFEMAAMLDLSGKFQSVNRAFTQYLGWKPEALHDQTFWDLIVADQPVEPANYIRNLAKGHPIILTPNQIRTAAGGLRSIRWTAYPDPELETIFVILREVHQEDADYDLFKLAVEASPTVLLIITGDEIRYANQLTELIFGYHHEELIGKSVEMLIPSRFHHYHLRQRDGYKRHPYLRLMGTGIELVGQRKDGVEFPVDIGLNPVHTSSGLIIICSIIDLTKKIAAERSIAERIRQLEQEITKLDKLALTDPLTAINNRRALANQLELDYRIAQKENYPLSFLMIDIDNFKGYNDSYGHLAGDQALQILAMILVNSIRRTEYIARYGGEEFAVVIPMADTRDSETMAERLRTMVEEHDWPYQKITVSIGAVTIFPRANGLSGSEDMAVLIQRADKALYCSKRSGKNQVTHYNTMDSRSCYDDPVSSASPAK